MPSGLALERDAGRRLPDLLGGLLGSDKTSVKEHARGYDRGIDLIVKVADRTFDVEVTSDSSIASLKGAVERLRKYRTAAHQKHIPLLVVPFMGEAGQRLCAELEQNWLDLSGNADIRGPGLRILVTGKPNLYKRPGRPSTAFAPRAARITRWLLMHPGEMFTQKQLADATSSDKGYTSKVIGRLLADNLVAMDGSSYRVIDPKLLFAAWREAYDFRKHAVVSGLVAARDGEGAVRDLTKRLRQRSIAHAATGLAGAWFIDHFAMFRIATLYVQEEPSDALLNELKVTTTARGANVWLVVPNDVGVLQGAAEYDGVTCAHPLQVYLDLEAHPERSEEAAEHLAQTKLKKFGVGDSP